MLKNTVNIRFMLSRSSFMAWTRAYPLPKATAKITFIAQLNKSLAFFFVIRWKLMFFWASRFVALRAPRVGLSAPSAAASLRSLAAGSASIPLATASLLQNCNKDAFLFFPDYLPFWSFGFASATVAWRVASVLCLIASVFLLFSTVAASARSFKTFFCLFMPASRSF